MKKGVELEKLGEVWTRLNEPNNMFRKGRKIVGRRSHKVERTAEDEHIDAALLDATELMVKRAKFGIPASGDARKIEMRSIRKIARFLNHVLAVEEARKVR